MHVQTSTVSRVGKADTVYMYPPPKRIMRVDTYMSTPTSESEYAIGYPFREPIYYHQPHNGQPISHQTPNHPPAGSPAPAGQANPTLRFSTPPEETKTPQFSALNIQLKELWIKIKLDVKKILSLCWFRKTGQTFGKEDAQPLKAVEVSSGGGSSPTHYNQQTASPDDSESIKSFTSSSSGDTTPGSGFGSRRSSFSHFDGSSASSLSRSASLQLDAALKSLKDTPIAINHPEGATWTSLDFLPGYEKSDHYINMDGNCLFRAFAHFKHGDQGKYADVKKEIIEYMLNNPGKFGEALEGEGTNLDKVRRRVAELEAGEWGDEPEIKAFVNKYQMNLVVVSKSSQSLLVNVHHSPNPIQNNFKGLVLEHSHYELLRKAPE